jgi:translation elongation factor EF-Ts
VEGMGDLIQAFKDTQATLEKAVEILRSESVAFRIRDAEINP